MSLLKRLNIVCTEARVIQFEFSGLTLGLSAASILVLLVYLFQQTAHVRSLALRVPLLHVMQLLRTPQVVGADELSNLVIASFGETPQAVVLGELEHLLSIFERLVIQIAVLDHLIAGVLQLQVLGLLALFFRAFEEVTWHRLRPAQLLLRRLLAHVFLFLPQLLVLDALHSKLIGKAVVDHPCWQLRVLLLLRRSVMNIKHFLVVVMLTVV